jgi:hypothetical protein
MKESHMITDLDSHRPSPTISRSSPDVNHAARRLNAAVSRNSVDCVDCARAPLTFLPLKRFEDREPPAFPPETLPIWLRGFVDELAAETQTPPDLAAMLGLSVIGAANAGSVQVEAWGSWREPLNLYVAVALPPASRKSAVFQRMIGPVQDHQRDLQE